MSELFACKPMKCTLRTDQCEVWCCNHGHTHITVKKASTDVKAGQPVEFKIDNADDAWEVADAVLRSYDTIVGID